METRVKSGLWNGGKVFGYVVNENKELDIVEDEAEVIKEIFHHFVIES